MPPADTILLELPVNRQFQYIVTREHPERCIHGVQMGPCYPCRDMIIGTPVFVDQNGPVYKDDLDADALRDGKLKRGK